MFRILFLLTLLPYAATAEERGILELKPIGLQRFFKNDRSSIISFYVRLESPHKGRLHKVTCRLDENEFNSEDKPISTVSYAAYQNPNPETRRFSFQVPPDRANETLNVFCQAVARL
jgi:hypothetical protein